MSRDFATRHMKASEVKIEEDVNKLVCFFSSRRRHTRCSRDWSSDVCSSDYYKNFSPRVGFNWDITGKGTTVLRGGSSVIYSFYTPAQWMQSSPQSFGGGAFHLVPTGACTVAVSPGTPCPSTFGGTITTANAVIPGSFLDWNNVVFPKGAVFSCTEAVPCNIVTVDSNLKYPYIVNWNFGVQHALTNDLSLDVSYVGNHGDRLSGRRDINMVDPVTGDRPYAAKFP